MRTVFVAVGSKKHEVLVNKHIPVAEIVGNALTDKQAKRKAEDMIIVQMGFKLFEFMRTHKTRRVLIEITDTGRADVEAYINGDIQPCRMYYCRGTLQVVPGHENEHLRLL